MLLGCFSTLLIKETARKTLEELSGDEDYTVSAVSPSPRHDSAEGGVIEKKSPESV
jgi:PHS family inorganic phosphate transporter-like MFS transporter